MLIQYSSKQNIELNSLTESTPSNQQYGYTERDSKINERSLLETLVTDKSKILKSTIKALSDEIKRREQLHSNLVDQIEMEIFSSRDKIEIMKKMKQGYDFALMNQVMKNRLKLEDRVSELGKEIRKEKVECWRDLMELNKQMLQSLREYWTLVRRKALLE